MDVGPTVNSPLLAHQVVIDFSITTCPTKAVYGIIVCPSGHGAFSTMTVSHFPLREGDYLRSFIVLFSKGVWLIWVDA